jgi:hypothetical protein
MLKCMQAGCRRMTGATDNFASRSTRVKVMKGTKNIYAALSEVS